MTDGVNLASTTENYVYRFGHRGGADGLREDIPFAGFGIQRSGPVTMPGILGKRQNPGALIIREQDLLHVVGWCGKTGDHIIPDQARAKITVARKTSILAISGPPNLLRVS